MTSVFLFAHAAVLAGPLAWWLRRTEWPSHRPALGVATWHVLAGSVLGTAVLGAFAAAPSGAGDHHHHNHLLVAQACVFTVAFLIAAALCLGRGLLTYLRIDRGHRRRHRLLLGLAGRRDERLGVVIVDHATATAYCVPGPAGEVVLTSGAIAALGDRELAAVLAHERAHLRGRHHLVVAATKVVRLAFPFIPAFRWAHAEVGRLVELLADDAAARRHGRTALADALVTLAGQGGVPATPPAALGASGSTVTARVNRLLDPERLPGRWVVAGWLLALVVLLAVPVLGAGPALTGAADLLSHCPFPG
jgi:Zn-dependent protease with chaperone function